MNPCQKREGGRTEGVAGAVISHLASLSPWWSCYSPRPWTRYRLINEPNDELKQVSITVSSSSSGKASAAAWRVSPEADLPPLTAPTPQHCLLWTFYFNHCSRKQREARADCLITVVASRRYHGSVTCDYRFQTRNRELCHGPHLTSLNWRWWGFFPVTV